MVDAILCSRYQKAEQEDHVIFQGQQGQKVILLWLNSLQDRCDQIVKLSNCLLGSHYYAPAPARSV